MHVDPSKSAPAGTPVILLNDIEIVYVKNLNGRNNPFRKGEIAFLHSGMSSYNTIVILSTSSDEKDYDSPRCLALRQNIFFGS